MASLTWDRGLRKWRSTTASASPPTSSVYFCDPQSPWQRGTNEEHERSIAPVLPQGPGLSVFTQARLNAIALRLNTRPRKTLGFMTPAEKLAACVATTG